MRQAGVDLMRKAGEEGNKAAERALQAMQKPTARANSRQRRELTTAAVVLSLQSTEARRRSQRRRGPGDTAPERSRRRELPRACQGLPVDSRIEGRRRQYRGTRGQAVVHLLACGFHHLRYGHRRRGRGIDVAPAEIREIALTGLLDAYFTARRRRAKREANAQDAIRGARRLDVSNHVHRPQNVAGRARIDGRFYRQLTTGGGKADNYPWWSIIRDPKG